MLFYCKYTYYTYKQPSPIQTEIFMQIKCVYSAGIEPWTFCVAGDYTNHYAKSVENQDFCRIVNAGSRLNQPLGRSYSDDDDEVQYQKLSRYE
jgi:hypothetical protein